MVEFNQEIGKTKGVTIIELGNGDLQVSMIHNKEDGYTGIQFVNDIKRPIGTHHAGMVGLTTDESEPSAIITFSNLESLSVFEKHLNYAKLKLKQQLKDKSE
jgi:hypothetical protein